MSLTTHFPHSALRAGITAVVCTYNGSGRLAEVMDALDSQAECDDFECRVIIVDNNSTDGTLARAKELAEAVQLPVDVLFEARQGKRFALELALEAVQTELTAIIDDDNIVPGDYFSKIYKRFQADQTIGFVGVSTRLVCEESPPSWWARQQTFYAVGRQTRESGYLEDFGKYSVWGAGMAFRTRIWQEAYSHYRSPLKGRNSINLVAGEDSELCLLASLLGYRGYVEADIVVGHRMPAARLSEAYLTRLRWSLGFGAIENQLLLDEWLIRRNRARPLLLAVKRLRPFALAYYRLKVFKFGFRILLAARSESIHLKAHRAAYLGCLDAVKAKNDLALWSFPFELTANPSA